MTAKGMMSVPFAKNRTNAKQKKPQVALRPMEAASKNIGGMLNLRIDKNDNRSYLGF